METEQPDASGEPGILLLNQEEINRLENVLSSDEGKTLLEDVLTAAGSISDDDQVRQMKTAGSSDSSSSLSGSVAPSRRSQRQIDREMKEEAERIRKENQALLQKEREELVGKQFSSNCVEAVEDDQSNEDAEGSSRAEAVADEENGDLPQPENSRAETGAEDASGHGSSVASGRPKRVRKVPVHMQGGDFVYGSSVNLASEQKSAPKKGSATPGTAFKKKASPLEAKSKTSPATIEISKSFKMEVQDELAGDIDDIDKGQTSLGTISLKGNEQDEKSNDDDDEDDEDEDEDGDWNSEDDPERLWCVCQQPHNNRFMICCDSCLDWYHGKCVGVTKKMGQAMEDAGNEWTCPTCRGSPMPSVDSRENKEQSKDSVPRTKGVKDGKKTASGKPKKSLIRRRPGSSMSNEGAKEEKKSKEKSCFMCPKQPRPDSIFCSNDCIAKHVERAKEFLDRNKPKQLLKKDQEVEKAKGGPISAAKVQPVMVMEPKSNTLLTGPNAPSELTLDVWLKAHPTFHVVMPTVEPSSKFYGTKLSSQKVEHNHRIEHHHNQQGLKKQPRQEYQRAIVNEKLKEYQTKKVTVVSSTASTSSHSSAEKKSTKGIKHDGKHELSRSLSGSSLSSAEDRRRHGPRSSLSSSVENSFSRRKNSEGSTTPYKESAAPSNVDVRALRKNVAKGLKDALKTRISKDSAESPSGSSSNTPLSVDDDKLRHLVAEIEREMYELYSRDVGAKYKAKYRSLVFNIKDEKNQGLYRKIIEGTYKPKHLVAMSADEMASKELRQWREAELKHDIEKIKSHEKELLQMGNRFVMKTHKGDMILEADGSGRGSSGGGIGGIGGSASQSKEPLEIKLPDEEKVEEVLVSGSDAHSQFSSKTWEHGNHPFESSCDVCTGKVTLDEFLVAKIEKEKLALKSKSRHHRSHHHHRHHTSPSSSSSSKLSKDSSNSHHHSRHSSSSNRRSQDHRDQDHKSRSRSGSRSRSSSTSHRHHNSSSSRKSTAESSGHKSDRSRYRPHDSKPVEGNGEKAKDQTSKKSVEITREVKVSSRGSMDKDHQHNRDDHRGKKNHEGGNALSTSSVPLDDGGPPLVTEEDVAKAEDIIKKALEVSNVTSKSAAEESEEQHVTSTTNSDTSSGGGSCKDGESKQQPSQSETTSQLDSNPVVWKGDINMPDVAKFLVKATQVSGTADYLTVDLRETMRIVGRIAPQTVWDYVGQLAESPTKEILVIRLEPRSEDERSKYVSFFSYLQQRGRLGVVGNNCKMVKDCYIVPLASADPVPKCLLPLDGPGLEEQRPDLLLALVVRSRRQRPGDSDRSKSSAPSLMGPSTVSRQEAAKGSLKRKAPSFDDTPYDPLSAGKDLETGSADKKDINDDDVYDPESAAFLPLPDLDDDLEAGSSMTSTKKHAHGSHHHGHHHLKKKVRVEVIDDDEVEEEQSSNRQEQSAAYSDKLAELTREIEEHKAEIAKKTQNLGELSTADDATGLKTTLLPSGIASILFGGHNADDSAGPSSNQPMVGGGHGNIGSSGMDRDPRKRATAPAGTSVNLASRTAPNGGGPSTLLGSMTDAELLAKAAAQIAETDPGGSRPGDFAYQQPMQFPTSSEPTFSYPLTDVGGGDAFDSDATFSAGRQGFQQTPEPVPPAGPWEQPPPWMQGGGDGGGEHPHALGGWRQVHDGGPPLPFSQPRFKDTRGRGGFVNWRGNNDRRNRKRRADDYDYQQPMRTNDPYQAQAPGIDAAGGFFDNQSGSNHGGAAMRNFSSDHRSQPHLSSHEKGAMSEEPGPPGEDQGRP